jgi:hypothetical protein
MSLKQTLKDAWNRLECKMDGANVTLFASTQVNNELRKQGWAVQFNYVGTPMASFAGMGAVLCDVTNPRGEKVTTVEQRREYLDARREAALKVYGLK